MKRLLNIILYLVIPGLLPWGQMIAQEQEKNEVSVMGGVGISTLKYDLKQGEYKYGVGGTFGLGYSYFLNDDIGIGTGIEMSFYNSKATMNPFSDSYTTSDGTENFEYSYHVSNYKEKQNLMLINIPLMLQLQYPIFFDDHFCYLAIGGRIGFPVRSKYETGGATINTSAHYPQYNIILEEPASKGLGTFTEKNLKEDLDMKVSYMLSAELGMKWTIAEQLSLYTGIYCDYGLNDISKNGHTDKFLTYNQSKRSDLSNNSVLEAQHTQDGVTESFTNKVIPVSLGLKIRVAFRVPE